MECGRESVKRMSEGEKILLKKVEQHPEVECVQRNKLSTLNIVFTSQQ